MRTSRVRGILALAVLLTLSVAAAPSRGAGGAEVYALVGGRVVTVSGGVLEDGTVVLRDGLIEAVGAGVRPPGGRAGHRRQGPDRSRRGSSTGSAASACPRRAPARAGGRGAAPQPAAPARSRPQAFALDRIRAADALKARDTGVTTALVVPREGVLPGRSVLLNLSGDTAGGDGAAAAGGPAPAHGHARRASTRAR